MYLYVIAYIVFVILYCNDPIKKEKKNFHSFTGTLLYLYNLVLLKNLTLKEYVRPTYTFGLT